MPRTRPRRAAGLGARALRGDAASAAALGGVLVRLPRVLPRRTALPAPVERWARRLDREDRV